MAIDIMKKATVLCPLTSTKQLLKSLHAEGIIELVDVMERYEEARDALSRPSVSTADCDDELQKLSLIIGLLNTFAPEEKSFIQGLAPVPLLVDPDELNQLYQQFPLQKHYEHALDLDGEYRKIERAHGATENRLAELAPLAHFPYALEQLTRLQEVRLILGSISLKNLNTLKQTPEKPAGMHWEEIDPQGAVHDNSDPKNKAGKAPEVVWLLVAVLPDAETDARQVLNAHGFLEIALPQISGTVAEQIRSLEEDLVVQKQKLENVAGQVREMA
ncbi:MAG TPA: hypothetical protein PLZ53_01710, partial [Candidatus Hydrogenedentes bacterium]|nr:hypothetical protein [Candidatus Hydrogenedentota bacterium]